VLERTVPVHLGDDERNPVGETVGGGLVDDDRTPADGVGDELAAAGRADREEADVEVARDECVRGRLLDGEAVHFLACRAIARESADVRVAALAQQLERDPADRAGRADDTNCYAAIHAAIVPAFKRARSGRGPHRCPVRG